MIAGVTPLDDAAGFGQWHAARRLVEHGAHTTLWHSAALGLIDRVEAHFELCAGPARRRITAAARLVDELGPLLGLPSHER